MHPASTPPLVVLLRAAHGASKDRRRDQGSHRPRVGQVSPFSPRRRRQKPGVLGRDYRRESRAARGETVVDCLPSVPSPPLLLKSFSSSSSFSLVLVQPAGHPPRVLPARRRLHLEHPLRRPAGEGAELGPGVPVDPPPPPRVGPLHGSPRPPKQKSPGTSSPKSQGFPDHRSGLPLVHLPEQALGLRSIAPRDVHGARPRVNGEHGL